MSQSFMCPSCGAPLDYRGEMMTIQCPYCFTSSTVPIGLRSQSAAPVEPSVMLSFMSQATKLRELASLVQTGQKPAAVSLYQQIYKVDAATAVRAVNTLTGGGDVLVLGEVSTPTPTYTSPSPTSTYTPPPTPLVGVSTPFGVDSPPIRDLSSGQIKYIPGTGSRRNPVMVMVGVISSMCIFTLAIVFIGGFAIWSNASSSISNLPDVNATIQRDFTQSAMVFTEQSQAKTQLARTPSPAPTLTPIPSATPTRDPGPELTVTAEFIARVTAAAELATTAQSWPIAYQQNFDGAAAGWDVVTNEDNDYYTGSHVVAGGVYRWDVTSKRDVISFVWPDPYRPVGDFYAALDFTIIDATDDDIAAGFTFFHTADDENLAYFVIDSGGDFRTVLLFGQSTISNSNSAAPLQPGPNRLAMVAVSNHLVLLLNDEVIDSLDTVFSTEGNVGVAVLFPESNQSAVIEFDNFEIRTPD